MIRTAKGVALHDLSFWDDTLPLLARLPRAMKGYEREIGRPIDMHLDPESAGDVHDRVLSRVVALWGDRKFVDVRSRSPVEDRLAARICHELPYDSDYESIPSVLVAIPGCGVITGGVCDLIWASFVVELKLTLASPAVRDVRQALVYAALLRLAEGEGFSSEVVTVMNPRLGVAAELPIEEILSISGGLDLDSFTDKLSEFASTVELQPVDEPLLPVGGE